MSITIRTNKIQEPIFHTKTGWLTRYALSCGYIEQAHLPLGVSISLSLDGNSYAVKAFDHNNGTRLAWDNFDSLVLARRRYSELVACYK